MADLTKTRSSVIERARRGEWSDFLRIYPPLIFGFAVRRGLSADQAEEVAQDTMAVLVRRLPAFEYDRSKGGFKAYLRKMVHDQVVDRLRRHRPVEGTEALEGVADGQPTPEEIFDRQWEREHLRRALEVVRREVKPSTYQSFELYVLREWPTKEICEFLSLSPNQVFQNKRRVIHRLRELMRELEDDDE